MTISTKVKLKQSIIKRKFNIYRVSTVLNELAEAIKPEMFSNDLFEYVPVATLQRLGYILEKVLEYDSLANTLYEIFEQKSI